jgi:ATP-dependent DNA helicase RecG
MDISSLKKLLQAGEWTDLECKEARTSGPKSALETVSAFANTHGGWLVFGIADRRNGEYEIVGVEKPDKVQNDFLSTLRAKGKLSHEVTIAESRHIVDGRTVLLFRVAENPRTGKPLYLDGDLRRTFLRRGGGDYKAQPHEIERLIRDAHKDRWDGQPFEKTALKEAFHTGTLKWYREKFQQAILGFNTEMTDQEFLYSWGFLLKDGRRFIPTQGAVMLFGSPLAVHQLLPRPTLDVQFLPYGRGEPLTETRWLDRLLCEDNIIQTWNALLAKYLFYMPKPFQDIDPETLGRRDDPPGFRVFREAAVNLLIHQDYGDHTRKAVIKFFSDGLEFWNPGDVFGDDSKLWEPGEKEVRNPSLVRAFRHISMCEQAGTGLRMMRDVWPKLGHPAPDYRNDRAGKSFELFLPGLDQELSQTSALVRKSLRSERSLQAHVEAHEAHVEDHESHVELAPWQAALLAACRTEPKTLQELLAVAGYKSRTGNFKKGLQNLLEQRLLEPTIPDRPRSRGQKYRLTDLGRQMAGQVYSGKA